MFAVAARCTNEKAASAVGETADAAGVSRVETEVGRKGDERGDPREETIESRTDLAQRHLKLPKSQQTSEGLSRVRMSIGRLEWCSKIRDPRCGP